MALRNSLALTGSITANSFFLADGSSVSGSLTVSDTAPAGAKNGSLWLNSNNLNTYVYYTDGDSSQWVSAGSIVSGSGSIPVQTNNSGKYLTTNGSDLTWANVTTLPTQTANSGKYLTTDGTSASWANVSALPSQTSNSGKYLTTDGTTASWANVSALPTQTGNSGKYLTTNGSSASWANVTSFTASQAYTMSILFGGS